VFLVEPAMHRDDRPAIADPDRHNMNIGVVIDIILDENALTHGKQSLDKLPRHYRFFHDIKHNVDFASTQNGCKHMNAYVGFSRRYKDGISITQLCGIFCVIMNTHINPVSIT
jgi:hypothetical protein